MKGLFNKVKNRLTRQRFVVSTIRKDAELFETAVFAANFFFMPRNWSNPALTVQTRDKDQAWDTHYQIAARLIAELPARVFEDYA
jgi:hypothetical protein